MNRQVVDWLSMTLEAALVHDMLRDTSRKRQCRVPALFVNFSSVKIILKGTTNVLYSSDRQVIGYNASPTQPRWLHSNADARES